MQKQVVRVKMVRFLVESKKEGITEILNVDIVNRCIDSGRL